MMKTPLVLIGWTGPCFARVELFGHAVRSFALCRPVELMHVSVVAVVRYERDWSGLTDGRLEVEYFGHGAIYRLTPIERGEFAAAVGEEAMAAFDALVKKQRVYDGESIEKQGDARAELAG